MSGRHRKPTDTTRTVLRAGVVAAAVTAPLAITGSAMAAPAAPQSDAKWDKIAKCESGGNWHANTGNPFSGGLQFTPSTWKAYGGKQYAPNAHQASREQQIAVAKKVAADQGMKAWPTCSKKA